MLNCKKKKIGIEIYLVHLKILYGIHFLYNINTESPNFESDLSPFFIDGDDE